MAKFVKLDTAAPHFKPNLEAGTEFDEDYDEQTVTALRAAGWCVPKAEAKKGKK